MNWSLGILVILVSLSALAPEYELNATEHQLKTEYDALKDPSPDAFIGFVEGKLKAVSSYTTLESFHLSLFIRNELPKIIHRLDFDQTMKIWSAARHDKIRLNPSIGPDFRRLARTKAKDFGEAFLAFTYLRTPDQAIENVEVEIESLLRFSASDYVELALDWPALRTTPFVFEVARRRLLEAHMRSVRASAIAAFLPSRKASPLNGMSALSRNDLTGIKMMEFLDDLRREPSMIQFSTDDVRSAQALLRLVAPTPSTAADWIKGLNAPHMIERAGNTLETRTALTAAITRKMHLFMPEILASRPTSSELQELIKLAKDQKEPPEEAHKNLDALTDYGLANAMTGRELTQVLKEIDIHPQDQAGLAKLWERGNLELNRLARLNRPWSEILSTAKVIYERRFSSPLQEDAHLFSQVSDATQAAIESLGKGQKSLAAEFHAARTQIRPWSKPSVPATDWLATMGALYDRVQAARATPEVSEGPVVRIRKAMCLFALSGIR